MITKDFRNTEIQIGDTIAVIFHGGDYFFCIRAAKITGVYGKNKRELETALVDNEHVTRGFLPDETGERYPKAVKIDFVLAPEDYDGTIDAIGQAIHIGDHIVCAKKTELGGVNLKGFEEGGKVTKLTECYAFYENEGKQRKKKLKWVVKC